MFLRLESAPVESSIRLRDLRTQEENKRGVVNPEQDDYERASGPISPDFPDNSSISM